MTNRMEWKPIETAPRDWSSIIVATDTGRVAEARMSDDGGVGWWDFDQIDLNDEDARHHPIAWMPMPAHPLVDHPRPTTPVVDHEGGESERQASGIEPDSGLSYAYIRHMSGEEDRAEDKARRAKAM